MIVLRRFLALLLAIVFLVFFLVSSILLRVNATFLEPAFVKEELRKADLFTFAYDDILPAALEENWGQAPELPLGLTLTNQDIVNAAQQILPPQWIQGRVEAAIDQFWPYMTGGRDNFEITVPLADRVEAVVPVAKDTLRKAGVYTLASSPGFTEELDKRLGEFGGLPFGLRLSSQQIASALQKILPPEWLQGQVEATLDEVVPYLAGQKDSFQLTVPVADRVETAISVLKDLLREVDAYDRILKEVVVKIVEERIGQLAQLPFGVFITHDEIAAAMQQVAPPQWLQEQVERSIDAFTPYITGKADTFVITLPLAERVEAVERVIDELADRKLRELFNSLPPCTLEQALELGKKAPSGELPSCRPAGFTLEEIKRSLGIAAPGVTREDIERQLGIDLSFAISGLTYEDLKKKANIDIAAGVKQFIRDKLPSQWTFTEADLRKLLNPEHEEILDNAKKIISQGWTFTDADLRKQLGEDAQTLDEARETIRDGWTFTEADLREALSKNDPQAVQSLDQLRDGLSLARSLRFLPYLVGAFLLALIGLLGGRRRRSKVAWAVVVLGVAALFSYISISQVYSGLILPPFEEARASIEATGVQRMATEKGFAVAKMVMEDFFSGLKAQFLLYLVVSGVILSLALAWGRLTQALRRR